MIARLLNTKSDSLTKATVIIAVFSLLAKFSGLIRDAVFSNRFGTSVLIDAYFAAFRIPDFIFNLLFLGTVSVAFIPVFSDYLFKDRDRAFRIASGIANSTIFGVIGISLFALLFIDPLVRVIAPGFTGEAYELTRSFTKILLFSPLFLSLSSITSSILHTYKKFAVVAAAPLVYNLSIIFGVLVLYPIMGPIGLPIGVVIGALLHFLIQLPQVFFMGFRYSLVLALRDSGFIQFWKLYWPRIFSMGTSQVTLLVATIFGSFLGTGSLSVFYYANNLQAVFLSIFAISAAIAVFPTLSEYFNQRDDQKFKDVLARTTIQILYFIIPLSVLMLILRAQIVRLVLGIGENTSFTFADTRVVSLTLGLFVVSLFAQALAPLFTRAFYARHNTAIPVIIGLIVIVVNVFATYFFVRRFGIPGMAIAFSLTSIIHLVMLVMELHKKIGHIHDEYLIINSLKIVIGSALSAAGAYVSLYLIAPLVNMQTYVGVFTQAAGASLVGLVIYLGITWFSGLAETHGLVNLLKSMLIKFSRNINSAWYTRE
ncbi:MAG: murein biosynthesis integral membrane protein MurJ [Candidatus Doudnabacteria bacterium]|nr:murein biosynthesis integral membrane protein MurJ [Candidatus Doudnabacteria bacterium]